MCVIGLYNVNQQNKMKNIKKNTNQTSAVKLNKVEEDEELIELESVDFNNASDVIKNLSPDIPAYLYRSKAVKKAASWFVKNFKDFESEVNGAKYNSRTLFSVKSNSDERVARDVFGNGVTDFDVASIKEVRQIHSLFGKDVKMYFMHPVKSREAIDEAYFKYGIRDFSFDSSEELKKILEVTKEAKDLSLHLRIKMNCRDSAVNLSGKFGINLKKSQSLAKKARQAAEKFGVCFHVGSQCMDPRQYSAAIKRVAEFFDEAGVELDSFDIGGGFPADYPGMNIRPMEDYLDRIKKAISLTSLKEGCEILCEPGRALVAECESLLVRVEAKKGKLLYINDGSYGGLFDAGILGFSYFCSAFKSNGRKIKSENEKKYSFYGPTCDSLDFMKGPFVLPEEIEVGDYIEIYNLGAYSKTLRTSFNGYDDILQLNVA